MNGIALNGKPKATYPALRSLNNKDAHGNRTHL